MGCKRTFQLAIPGGVRGTPIGGSKGTSPEDVGQDPHHELDTPGTSRQSLEESSHSSHRTGPVEEGEGHNFAYVVAYQNQPSPNPIGVKRERI